MAMINPHGSSSLMSDINITPFVDVMLVLLVIFMVTAPLVQQGLQVDLPKTKAKSLETSEDKLILTITKEKKVFLGKTEIPYDGLAEKLKYNARLKEEKEVFLQADRNLEYGVVVDVMAILKDSGVDQIGMITEPGEMGSGG